MENKNYGNKVALQFKHIGAKVNVAFRESVDGYKVELINVSTENGIELTPAIYDASKATPAEQFTKGKYSNTSSVKIKYNTSAEPSTSTETTPICDDNLKFALPTEGLTGYPTADPKYNILPEAANTYAVSPTTYYAVVQPTSSTGFTLHVSYKLIAEDNGEEITVSDARVFIPADQVKWESNKAYTYNFTIIVFTELAGISTVAA